jgi:hypothetical protein
LAIAVQSLIQLPPEFRARLDHAQRVENRRDAQRRRRGIFVETKPKIKSCPVGAAYFVNFQTISLLTELYPFSEYQSTKMSALRVLRIKTVAGIFRH